MAWMKLENRKLAAKGICGLGSVCLAGYLVPSVNTDYSSGHTRVLAALFWGAVTLFVLAAAVFPWRRFRASFAADPATPQGTAGKRQLSPGQQRAGTWLGLAGIASTVACSVAGGSSNSPLLSVFLFLLGFLLFCVAGSVGSRAWLAVSVVEAVFVVYLLDNFRVGW